MYQDLGKVYKVQYVLLKERRLKLQRKAKGLKAQMIDSFELRDENSNQILVNM